MVIYNSASPSDFILFPEAVIKFCLDKLSTSFESCHRILLSIILTAIEHDIVLRAFNMFQAQLYMSIGNKDKVFSIRLMNSLQDYASTGMLVAVIY